MRAGTCHAGILYFWICLPCNTPDGVEHFIDASVCYPIKDIPALPPVLDQPCSTQNCQLLGDVSLAVTQVCFHVADAVLAIPENHQDR